MVRDAKKFVLSIYPKAKPFMLSNGFYIIDIDNIRYVCLIPAKTIGKAWVIAEKEIKMKMLKKLEQTSNPLIDWNDYDI